MDDDLRAEILSALGLMQESSATQESMLMQIESIADKRLAYLLPQLLMPVQMEEADRMLTQGTAAENLKHWMVMNVPNGPELVRSVYLDIATEAAGQSR